MISLPAETPLYNHPLPEIERWLIEQGCQQNRSQLHCWYVKRDTWEAEIALEIDQLMVRYFNMDEEGRELQRAFKYSLSRQDVEDAVFSGP
ncbi:DUF3143 domain-containing protein [Desertifilum sp. FACHB-1129]|uniref:DUF3143 domain-containing protein n=1 Tax=Desertifilum tharense IPPAS B-1220 TaxID=1781255 RepID=A0A1E5QM66_9CYAN|nr:MULTISPECIES: DUF3143 domain-containing protein [Desertifilum]MCD8488696.1 DUF3143 domain-containing protein [Desertifilum sp.]MDA0209951.1 DUF3143 domain-containing protein [Cyanobacteria bacterium FC1]MDK3155110.1 DUF3143 domain-containing protein [Kamptonema cortianum]MBD2313781.1 DUF3143 domain-containing protein [Desertifilum sp. FACHB-1129]MBD2324508.1 DUF3143 domain-containing protein [Desertifilum sp. FACHB-866]